VKRHSCIAAPKQQLPRPHPADPSCRAVCVAAQASEAGLVALAARHDGCLLAASDADSRVHVWDVRKVRPALPDGLRMRGSSRCLARAAAWAPPQRPATKAPPHLRLSAQPKAMLQHLPV